MAARAFGLGMLPIQEKSCHLMVKADIFPVCGDMAFLAIETHLVGMRAPLCV